MSEDDQYIVGPAELISAAFENYRALNQRVQSLELNSQYKLLEALRGGFNAGEEFLERAKDQATQKSIFARFLGSDNEELYELLLARDVDDPEGIGGVFRQSLRALDHTDVEKVASSYGKFAGESELEKQDETLYDLETVLTTVQLLQIKTQDLESNSSWSEAMILNDYFLSRHKERESIYTGKIVGFERYLGSIHDALEYINQEIGIEILRLGKEDKELLEDLTKTLASPLGEAEKYFEKAVQSLNAVKILRDQKKGTKKIERKILDIKPLIDALHPENLIFNSHVNRMSN